MFSWSEAMLAAEWPIGAMMLLVLVTSQRRLTVTIAWVAVVILLPWLGLLAYLLVGENRLGRRRRYARDLHQRATGGRRSLPRTHVVSPEVDEGHEALIGGAQRLVGLPIRGGNTVDLLPVAAEFVDELVSRIDAARTQVYLMYFTFEDDGVGRRVGEALMRASARGVRVDIMMPRRSGKRRCDAAARFHFAQMVESGIRVHLNRGGMPHAKTMTVDEGFAMLGWANSDIRSFFVNFELNLLLYEAGANEQPRACRPRSVEEADEVTRATLGAMPAWKRIGSSCGMLLSPLP